MQTSETIGKISEALAKAQGEMKPAVFDATNPHFRSRYATLASIMSASREALSKNNLAVVQGTSVEADRVIISTMLVHSSGEWIKDQLSMNIVKDSPQAVGSAITYGRRYSLASMVGIVADQDDDAEGAESGKKETDNSIHSYGNSEKSGKGKKPEKSVGKPEGKQEPRSDVKSTETSKLITPPKTQINARVGKIRSIFNLSAKLGHTPDQMKKVIGELIGVPGGIKESADIPDGKLDVIVEAFSSQLEALQKQNERVAA